MKSTLDCQSYLSALPFRVGSELTWFQAAKVKDQEENDVLVRKLLPYTIFLKTFSTELFSAQKIAEWIFVLILMLILNCNNFHFVSNSAS